MNVIEKWIKKELPEEKWDILMIEIECPHCNDAKVRFTSNGGIHSCPSCDGLTRLKFGSPSVGVIFKLTALPHKVAVAAKPEGENGCKATILMYQVDPRYILFRAIL